MMLNHPKTLPVAIRRLMDEVERGEPSRESYDRAHNRHNRSGGGGWAPTPRPQPQPDPAPIDPEQKEEEAS